MNYLEKSSCPNKDCINFGKVNFGNIKVRGKCGKDKDKILLYCTTCGKRFMSTRGTFLYGTHLKEEIVKEIVRLYAEGKSLRMIATNLELSKDTVNSVIQKICTKTKTVLTELMETLMFDEKLMDDLWTIVKKKKLLKSKEINSIEIKDETKIS